MLRSTYLTFMLCMGLVLTGCSGGGEGASDNPPTYELTGTVSYNGDPVDGASVSFQSSSGDSKVGAAGKTDASGQFTLTTFKPGDGAVAGTHDVVVIKSVVEGEDPSYFDETSPNYGKTPPPTTTKYLIPEKYGKFETSDLKAEVTADGPNEIKLELKD